MDRKLENKVAIITGGASGIGRATAEAYAREGAKVAIVDFRGDVAEEAAGEICGSGAEAIALQADVSDAEEVRRVIECTEQHFGALHIMTANAGANAGLAPLHEADLDVWKAAFDVLFFGVLYSMKFAVPPILRSGGGAITVTGSIAGHRGMANVTCYTSAKAGIMGLVRCVASENLGAIRVNCVSPGETQTDLRASAARWRAERKIGDPAQWSADHAPKRDSSWGRTADPEEIAAVHLFLASNDASFITGQDIIADGGKLIQPLTGVKVG